MPALLGALVGGLALLLVIVGILELVLPATVMRVRRWLMVDGPAALDAVGDAFDRGLRTGSDARHSRLRGVGVVLTATGVMLLVIAWRST